MHDRRVGEVLDERFELLGFAGAGGMGAVYRALDRAAQRVVALKVIDGAEGLGREAELLAAIDHPAVVRYLDHGVTRDGSRFVAMEWITGLDLESWLARGRIEVAQAIALARQVAGALAAIHARGVVHRDVKPANLLLVDDRVDAVKLVDFGIAGELEDLERSDPGVVIGTPEYMAPEALRGDPVDERADVYGLGAVLFRALAGRPVFTGAHRIAILAKVLLEVPAPICDLRPDVPLELEELLGRMLAKDPARRPADGAAVVRAFDELEAAPPTEPGRRGRPAVTAGEQRVSCLVMCSGRGRAGATLPLARLRREDVDVERVAARAGGVLEALPSGGLLVHVARGTPAERAARAASCALAIAAARPGTPIVVATGQVVTTGDSAIGDVIDVHSASRRDAARSSEAGPIDRAAAEVAAAPAGAWVDATTASLLDERFELADADDAGAGGGVAGTGSSPRLELPVSASGSWRAAPRWYRLVGERDAIAPVRLFMGRPAPCVGRAPELAALAAALEDAFDAPRARAVLVTAPPGLGKSRLVHELLAAPRAREATVLGARGDVARAGSPFALVSSLLAAAARTGVAGADRVAAMVHEHDAGGRAADPAVMTDAIRAAWCDWLAAVARRPLVIVVEDLHWGDLPSLRLVDAALGALAAQPVLVVATARPEVRDLFPSLWSARDVWELRLGRLARRAAEQLVRATLGDVDAELVAALVARAAGHPFHLEELVRAVAGGAGPDALPETVLGMVQARLDVLGAAARRVLRAASVFGESFTSDGVAALVGDAVPRDALARCITELCDQENRDAHRPRARVPPRARARGGVRDAAGARPRGRAPRRRAVARGHRLQRRGDARAIASIAAARRSARCASSGAPPSRRSTARTSCARPRSSSARCAAAPTTPSTATCARSRPRSRCGAASSRSRPSARCPRRSYSSPGRRRGSARCRTRSRRSASAARTRASPSSSTARRRRSCTTRPTRARRAARARRRCAAGSRSCTGRTTEATSRGRSGASTRSRPRCSTRSTPAGCSACARSRRGCTGATSIARSRRSACRSTRSRRRARGGRCA